MWGKLVSKGPKAREPEWSKPTEKVTKAKPFDLSGDHIPIWDTEAYKKWEEQHKAFLESQAEMQKWMETLKSGLYTVPNVTGTASMDTPQLIPTNSPYAYGDWNISSGWAKYPHQFINVKIDGMVVEVPKVSNSFTPSILHEDVLATPDDPYGWMVIVHNNAGFPSQFISMGVKRKTKCGKFYGAWTKVTPSLDTLYPNWADLVVEKLKKYATEINEWAEPEPVSITIP